MSGRFPWKSIVLCIVMFATRSATAAEPGLTTVDPQSYPVAPTPETPPAVSAAGSTHVFEAFRSHVEQARTLRMATGISSMIVGGAAVGAGVYYQEVWHDGFAYVLTIAGGVSILGGGLTMLIKSEVESLADAHAVTTTSSPTPEQEAALERDWEKAALKTRAARQLGGAISFGLTALAAGTAVYVVAAEPVEDETEHWLVPTLIIGGAATAAGGLVAFMVEMPAEAAYRQYKATRTTKPPDSGMTNVRVGAALLPNGGFVSVSSAF